MRKIPYATSNQFHVTSGGYTSDTWYNWYPTSPTTWPTARKFRSRPISNPAGINIGEVTEVIDVPEPAPKEAPVEAPVPEREKEEVPA